MRVIVEQGRAKGSVFAPPSKSMAHRLLICAAFSEGKSTVHGVAPCEDVLATIDCLRALGARVEYAGDTVRVSGIDPRQTVPNAPLACRESGSTLRFLIPIAWLSGHEAKMVGAHYLMQRPMNVYERIAAEKGLLFSKEGQEINVKGRLPAGEYTVPGNISSQFISGLLFALPLADGDSVIRILPPVESRSYLNLTVAALREFGVEVSWIDEYTIRTRGNQRYRSCETTVEGDYSNAAFLDALSLVGGDVEVLGLRRDSLQGDRVYRAFYEQLKQKRSALSIEDCPDLGPILFAMAAAGHGGVFQGTKRLRIKESDRAAAMASELQKLGVSVCVDEDTLTVEPALLHAPTEPIDGHNDHRIVMSMAVLLTLVGGEIEGAEAVKKSFPDFFDRLRDLGLRIREE
ncbi:MAG: 3-phosphoshikimate 1-carboxyvinyltransferase [Clostridia bacterium]|nr:3-phosphoshikimate 1-carboxyvinyltransferase [Clostridia bacterium]